MKLPIGTCGEALSPALQDAKRICFQPFNMGKWFVMGFCAFLATLELNLPTNFNSSGGGRRGGPGAGPDFDEIQRWISANLSFVFVLIAVGAVVFLALAILFAFLRSRGNFMFLDNIIKNRASVVETWSAYAVQASSYFKFMLVMLGCNIAAFILAALLGLAIAYPDISAGRFEMMAFFGLIIFILILLPLMIILGIVSALAHDFVTPIMYLRSTTFAPAWREARENVFRGNFWAIFLYFLLKGALTLAGGIIVFIAGCVTCCIGFIPYLSSVLCLPIHVFNFSYALRFLEHCHPDYRMMADSEPRGFPVTPYEVSFNTPLGAPPPPPPPPPRRF